VAPRPWASDLLSLLRSRRGALVFFGLAALTPLAVRDAYFLDSLVLILLWGALSAAWNVAGGYAGQVSIGHASFFGIGAYAAALMVTRFGHGPWLGILVGVVLSVAAGLAIGFLSTRLKGPYFALSTIAFSQVLLIGVSRWRGFTAGAEGIPVPFRPGFGTLGLGHVAWVYVALAVALLYYAIEVYLERSRVGYQLAGVREDEDAAEALGIPTQRLKVFAVALSAALASICGSLWAQYIGFVDPAYVFSLDLSVKFALNAIIGGVGTALGPFLGSVLITSLETYLRATFSGVRTGFTGIYLILYGTVLILVVRFAPRGLAGILARRGLRLRSEPPLRMAPARPAVEAESHERRMVGNVPGPMLAIEGVTKRFGGLTAVRDVTVRVETGDLLGIIGPNGAGKTTLFNLISGYYRPDEGRVHLEGRDVTGLPPHTICRLGLTRTFQLVKPFGNLSVLDNVMIGALSRFGGVSTAYAEAERVVETCGLGPHRDARARALPIGLRKRLEVARALATRPRLLLLDEVMSGLNPAELGGMIDLLRRLHAGGLTLIVIEHIMAAMMQLAHRIVVLHHGERIAEGPPHAITSDRRVIDAYLGEEFVLAQA
jgi:branched-chain amino acid transport system permease protein